MQSVPASDPHFFASASLSSSFDQTSPGEVFMFSLLKTEGHYMAGTRHKKMYLQYCRSLYRENFRKQESKIGMTFKNGFKRTARKTHTINF